MRLLRRGGEHGVLGSSHLRIRIRLVGHNDRWSGVPYLEHPRDPTRPRHMIYPRQGKSLSTRTEYHLGRRSALVHRVH